MFRFREFKVYKDSKKFINNCDKALTHIEKQDKSLVWQIRAALLSIILNIAEGSGCDNDKEFRRFLEISLRSIYEVVAGFDFAMETKLINKDEFETIELEAEDLCKQLNGFRRSLKSTYSSN